MAKLKSELEVACPCCDAVLVIDLNLRRVVSHTVPERSDKPELNDATRILEAEAARRESLFEQSIAAEKGRDDALTRRFEEALKKAKQEPVTRPARDFDLD
ncbi:MAG TPA: hypothetical protein VFP16_04335 [Vicinamibacterales bacterium]|jgi:hypothetical protein|nr:hypothetical protein [Vicinamibacterales bacterium]